MATIKIINSIELSSKGLRIHDAKNHYAEVFMRQGSLDGVCVVYSLVMCLLVQGYLIKKDTEVYNNADKRTAKGKMLANFMENNGFVRDGYSFCTLKKEIEQYCPNELNVTRKLKTDADTIYNYLAKNIPVIINVLWPDSGHTMLAVGAELDGKNRPVKILCLDPDSDAPLNSYWNSYIEFTSSDSEYPHWYVHSSGKEKVLLHDMLVIKNLLKNKNKKNC